MIDGQECAAKVRAGTALRRAEVRGIDAATNALRNAFRGTEQAAKTLHGDGAGTETASVIRRAARAAAEEAIHAGPHRPARRPGGARKPAAGTRQQGRRPRTGGTAAAKPKPNENATTTGSGPATI